MPTLLLGRYRLVAELDPSGPVRAHDDVLDRDVDVLLRCDGRPARQVLADLRATLQRPGEAAARNLRYTEQASRRGSLAPDRVSRTNTVVSALAG